MSTTEIRSAATAPDENGAAIAVRGTDRSLDGAVAC